MTSLYVGTSSLNLMGKKSFYDIISVPTISHNTENQVCSSCSLCILGFNRVKSGCRPAEWKNVVGVNCQCSGWPQVGLSGRGDEGHGKTSFLSGQQLLRSGRNITYTSSESLQEHRIAVMVITYWYCSPTASQ